jgi:hypothetical protein
MNRPEGNFVGRCRTLDACSRMFAEGELDSLEAELTDLELRLDAFLHHVRKANLGRSRHLGSYSYAVATLSSRCDVLTRVRSWIASDRHYPTEAAQLPQPGSEPAGAQN